MTAGMRNWDVIVVGGGLVGAAFALSLGKSGYSVALIEGRPPLAPPVDDSWDSRIYAISRASQSVLDSAGAWGRMRQERIQPVQQMAVRGDGQALLEFSAVEAGISELTWIVESREMQWALWQSLQQADVTLLSPARPVSATWTPTDAQLKLDSGETVSARLLVGADGAQSWLRQQGDIDTTAAPYCQKGVVANFQCEKAHGSIARQWFREDGILAWLPLPGNRISIVFSTWNEQADSLCALPSAELAKVVAEAGDHALGGLECITPAAGFPLRLLHVHEIVKPRLALIGDAAHNVHPLAGQGVNLGFEDARDLANVLNAAGGRDPGDYLLLRRYERLRREDVYAMQGVTHALQKLFNNANPVLKPLRNAGLAITNQLPWIKRQLIRQALA